MLGTWVPHSVWPTPLLLSSGHQPQVCSGTQLFSCRLGCHLCTPHFPTVTLPKGVVRARWERALTEQVDTLVTLLPARCRYLVTAPVFFCWFSHLLLLPPAWLPAHTHPHRQVGAVESLACLQRIKHDPRLLRGRHSQAAAWTLPGDGAVTEARPPAPGNHSSDRSPERWSRTGPPVFLVQVLPLGNLAHGAPWWQRAFAFYFKLKYITEKLTGSELRGKGSNAGEKKKSFLRTARKGL